MTLSTNISVFLGTGEAFFPTDQSRDPIANSESSESNKRTYTCSGCEVMTYNDPTDKTLKHCN